MGTPLGPKYTLYGYMEPLGFRVESQESRPAGALVLRG